MSRSKRRPRPKAVRAPVVARPTARADVELVDPRDPVIAEKNRRLMLVLVTAVVAVSVFLMVRELLPH